MAKYWRLNKMI